MAMRKRHEEHENHERWLVSYADFITLLFAFFVVLYATSAADHEKQKEVEDSIKKSFAAYLGGAGGGGSEFEEKNDSRNQSIMPPITQQFPPRGAGAGEVQNYVEKRVEKDLKDDDGDKTVQEIYHDTVGVRIQLAASRLFPTGSADLMTGSADALEKLGTMLRESHRRIIVEGHTDDEPIKTDKYPSNWELSASRATKIVRYLIARHKIPASSLTAVAYADQKPVVPNNSAENRARNRRIEIEIVTDKNADL